MDRRDFIRVAAAVAAAAPIAGVSLAGVWGEDHAVEVKRDLKKCLKIGMVQVGDSIEEKFRLLKKIGFDGVELDAPSGLDWREVLRAKEVIGFEIPGVVCSTHWSSPLSVGDPEARRKGLEGVEIALRDCRLYGGSTVLLVPGVCNEDVSYQQAWERSTAELRKLVPLCEQLDVKIAFENVWNNFITDAEEAVRYVDQFDSPYFGWYFDIGNIVRYGEPASWVKTLGKRLMKLDIKDYSRAKMKAEGVWRGFDCKIGDPDSSVGWAETMRAIDAIGYSGWGSAEVGGGNSDRLAEISRRMDDVFSR